ncbi:MAG: hypothetical protein Q4G62_07045 [Pseudomonadota bacterium]|nr:hypothetical protein [Pseudomonadota bacterium]
MKRLRDRLGKLEVPDDAGTGMLPSMVVIPHPGQPGHNEAVAKAKMLRARGAMVITCAPEDEEQAWGELVDHFV